MKKRYKFGILALVLAAIFVSTGMYLHHTGVAVLDPKGPIALKERNLLYLVLALSLFVVIPVYTAAIVFSIRYREGNKKEHHYSPDWDHSRMIETIWWLGPTILIGILSVITWQSTHALTPSKPLVSTNPTMTIQVVALDWKWLFIYPQQQVASVNYVTFPMQTPIDFEITADAPMNSFWIPQLGGQIYAMAGMTTNLNLMASVQGNFRGVSANISGVGFSGMTFTAHSSSAAAFNAWVASVRNGHQDLTQSVYNKLAGPSQNNPVTTYGVVENDLLNSILLKYDEPSNVTASMSNNAMAGMSMQ
jgi:cytochrome o ubiquinol oxidase subunit 2